MSLHLTFFPVLKLVEIIFLYEEPVMCKIVITVLLISSIVTKNITSNDLNKSSLFFDSDNFISS